MSWSALDSLVAAAEQVRRHDLRGESVGTVREHVAALIEARDALDAAPVSAVGVVEASGDWAADGARSCTSWLSAHSRLRSRDAWRLVHAGRFVRRHPAAGDRLRRGSVAVGNVDVLARAVTRQRVGL